MNLPIADDDTLYRALLEKDSTFEGLFVAAVKTTGVFCRPTCTARKPRRENVEFFATPGDALLHGYRPCRICRPEESRGAVPGWLQPALQELERDPETPLRADALRRLGIDPGRARRWFLSHHGMTFQAWQRALRLGRAFGRIRLGERVADSAFSAGYDSLSGFTEGFRRLTGFAPSQSGEGELVRITRLVTPLGPMLAGAVAAGICLLEFADRRMLETQLRRVGRRWRAGFAPGEGEPFATLQRELDEYFAGRRREFTVPLAMPGTPFQQRVWRVLQQIPYGTTRSYGEQALALGAPTAVRAVARANGDNPIAIVVPCHRVIGADGKLVGYGGGLWRKRFLLDLECGARRLAMPEMPAAEDRPGGDEGRGPARGGRGGNAR